MNISSAKGWAAAVLLNAKIPEFRREAASLLEFVLSKNSAFLIAHPEYELTEREEERFISTVNRRASREPFHYIVGRKEFYGLEFAVERGVLIPRPETEILVDAAIRIASEIKKPDFYEIGVGSGCVSIAILHGVSGSRGVGADISDIALSLTKKNAERHEVADRLTLYKADVYDGVSDRVDLVVSNPPYIPDGDIRSLQPEVGEFEPHTALFGGDDGLAIIRRIINGAPEFLKPDGYLAIEIGFGQAEIVYELFNKAIWENVEFIPDLQKIDRIVKARMRR